MARYLSDEALHRLRGVAGESELQPGTTFADRYRIDGYVGVGGMGVLFRAFDTKLLRRVALKVLHRDRSRSALSEESARVLREARAAAALNHPRVVAIHDVGEHDGVAFIAMELVEGRSLRALVGSRSSAAFDVRLRWMIEVAGVLAAAHEKGLVHRDVKPDNVMLTAEGSIKVLDFGIARYRDAAMDEGEGPGDEKRSAEGSATRVVGTPGYVAPEQLRGEDLDGRADQFAWAVTAYELFTGELPWRDGADPGSRDPAPHPGAMKPFPGGIPPHVTEVLRRALARDRGDRFPSMHQVVSALRDGAPESVPSADAAIARGSRRRGPRGVQVLLGGVLALGVWALVAGRSKVGQGLPAPPSAAAVAAPAVTTVMDLPISPQCNEPTAVLYRKGLMALRGSNWDDAHAAFEKAAEMDPYCPEAQMRLVITGESHYPIAKQREQYQRALRLRDALSERDRILLDAWAHVVLALPPNRIALTQALEDGTARFPFDAELLTNTGILRVNYVKDAAYHARTLELGQRAATLDPESGDAWQIQGRALWRMGRLDDALVAFRRCIEVVPRSADCRLDATAVSMEKGYCEQSAVELRQWLEVLPKTERGYALLAQVLASTGAPETAVEEALERRWSLLTDELRPIVRLHDRARLLVLRGHFERARELAMELSAKVEASSSLASHQRAADLLFETFAETGQTRQAIAVAEQYLVRREVWMGSDMDMGHESRDTVHGLEPMMLGLLFRQGRLDAGSWRAKAEAWEMSARRTLGARDAWAYAFGPVSDVRTEALGIWERRPSEGELTPSIAFGVSPAQMLEGRAALMANHPEEAVRLLQPATRRCRALSRPWMSTQAELWLGLAKERTGDVQGACEAYGVVLARWGNAKPRSKTADEARAHAMSLGCARTGG